MKQGKKLSAFNAEAQRKIERRAGKGPEKSKAPGATAASGAPRLKFNASPDSNSKDEGKNKTGSLPSEAPRFCPALLFAVSQKPYMLALDDAAGAFTFGTLK